MELGSQRPGASVSRMAVQEQWCTVQEEGMAFNMSKHVLAGVSFGMYCYFSPPNPPRANVEHHWSIISLDSPHLPAQRDPKGRSLADGAHESTLLAWGVQLSTQPCLAPSLCFLLCGLGRWSACNWRYSVRPLSTTGHNHTAEGLMDLEEGGLRGGRRGYLERGGLCSCPGSSLPSTCPLGVTTLALPSYQDSGAVDIMGEKAPYLLQGTSTMSIF